MQKVIKDQTNYQFCNSAAILVPCRQVHIKWFQIHASFLHHTLNQFFDVIPATKTRDYGIKNLIVIQKARGALEPLHNSAGHVDRAK